MTFDRALDNYFNGQDGYQPPVVPASGERKPLSQIVGHQQRTTRRATYTAAEIAQMQQWQAEGLTTEQIATMLGGRESAVARRLRQRRTA